MPSRVSPIMDEILVILGFILLILGAEGFVQGAVALASKFRVPPLLVGFTIVALGTSLPELAVVLEALDTEGGDDIAIGGIIGSNISNVMLVLGSAALLGASEYPGRGIRRDAIAVLMATLILVGATLFGSISQLLGVFMIFLLVAFYAYSYNHAKNHNVPPENENSMISNNLYFAVLVLIGGGVLVWIGADLLMTGVIGVMDKYGISQSVIGLTIVALGTSLPEFAVTVISALRGHGGSCPWKCFRFQCYEYFRNFGNRFDSWRRYINIFKFCRKRYLVIITFFGISMWNAT